ncbi:MAG: peptidylprolyl isomerase [Rhodothermia bacterium]|nr:peptidylprolyl isomerase [Rhodothermia bacterium]
MGLMTKMRDNTGAVLWILVVAFGIIFMLQDTNVFDVIGATGNVIGKVNGQDITLEEYNNYVNNQVEAYRQRTGESMPPQALDSERDRVFNELIDDRLREQEMNRLGIEVTDDEVRQMVLGDQPHQIIRTFFGDGQGNVDQAVLRNFIENPDAREDLIRIEDYLRTERRREKLDQLIGATIRVTEQDIIDEHRRQNARVDVRFVSLPYASVPDSAISVTERDLERFYDDHRDEFERKRAYTLSYVKISKAPTASDSSAIIEEIERLKPRFESAEDDSLFLVQNFSERPYTDAYFRRDELDDEIADAVFSNPSEGEVIGPVASGGAIHLVKIIDVAPADEKSVKARHILIRAAEGDDERRQYARDLVASIRDRIQAGEDFAELAQKLSDDPQSAQRGGDLGWFGPGRMVKPFEEAAFSARIGRLVGPVETQFGYHLIEVTDQSSRQVKIADFALNLTPSVATLSRIEENLGDLKFFAEEEGDFRSEADRRDLPVQSVQIEDGQQFIPGIGNSRVLTNFLETADEGELSPVVELNDDFIVARVDRIQEAGYRPFDEVRNELEPRVRLAKKKEVQVSKLEAAQSGDLESTAASVGSSVRVANGLTMANPVVSGLGREPQLVGAAFGLGEGERSGVIEGQNSAYIIEVVSLAEPSAISDTQKSQIRNQLLSQQRNQVQQRWLAALRDQADITDNRRIFLQ